MVFSVSTTILRAKIPRPHALVERRVAEVRPLTHGSVVVPNVLVAQQRENKHSVRRTDAALSVGDDLLLGVDTRTLEHCPNLGCWLEDTPIVAGHEVEPLDVLRSGHMARPAVTA
jgi:hypothetical protein